MFLCHFPPNNLRTVEVGLYSPLAPGMDGSHTPRIRSCAMCVVKTFFFSFLLPASRQSGIVLPSSDILSGVRHQHQQLSMGIHRLSAIKRWLLLSRRLFLLSLPLPLRPGANDGVHAGLVPALAPPGENPQV